MPKAAEHDVSGEYPWDIIKKAHRLGLMTAILPESVGGGGHGLFEGCLVGEEFAYACSGIGTAMMANELGQAPILMSGNDAQKKKYLGVNIREEQFRSHLLTIVAFSSLIENGRGTSNVRIWCYRARHRL